LVKRKADPVYDNSRDSRRTQKSANTNGFNLEHNLEAIAQTMSTVWGFIRFEEPTSIVASQGKELIAEVKMRNIEAEGKIFLDFASSEKLY